MQHKCAQHKWDHIIVFFKKLRNKCLRLKKKKIHMMKNTFHQTNRGRRERERKDFSHYLVSVKNRNSPVTFTLHFDYIHLCTWISLNYLSLSLMSLSTVYKRKKIAIKCIYSSKKMCLVTSFFVFLVEAGDVKRNGNIALLCAAKTWQINQ